MEQSRRPGGGVTAFSGNRQAVDKQPGQRQRDGQQQPGPQPGGKKNPHANVLPRSDVPHHPHGATRSAALQSPVPGHPPRRTTIAGPVAGQAALHGLLAKVRDLGLELLEARRTGGDQIDVARSGMLRNGRGSACQAQDQDTGDPATEGARPGLIAAVGTHIWVFGSDGVAVLIAPVTRPGRGQRPGRQAGP